MPQTPSTAGKSSVNYKPDSSPESPSDRYTRRRKRSQPSCGPTSQITSKDRPDSPPPPGDGPSGSERVTRSGAAKAKQGQQSRSSGGTPSYTQKQHNRNPCSQGLTRGGLLDLRCPNVSQHCEEGYQGNIHQLSDEEFRLLLERQLR